MTLSPDPTLTDFDRDGYVIFRDVIDPDLIAEVSDHVDWLEQQHPDVRPENLGHIYLRDDPFWVRLISDDRLVDIAARFIGDDVALFASHYISKPPFTGRQVLWHQDSAFWPLEPMEVVTLWLAVDHSTPENGCVRLIPGSHTLDTAALRERTDVENVLGAEIAVDVDESQAVDMVLKPGDVEVHHPKIVHGSNANTSPNRRCGLTIRYIPTSTRITADEQPYPSAFLLRGDPGVNTYQPVPTFDPARHFPHRGAA
ncbi:phytanoyl-CoA dioxygenase family protein [Microlunatus speluncae]|uniref:phytanoyl-CoA dioxygenase family protein n=1 Tax=Microlunatus speluncae TaxID=2594267 RepID=UPI0012662C00|nr:phytanoyl-CoA dioxygenase family protein [Microlunatus speluncae]